jgi:transcriptional regulator with XRE-family HTH domain
MTRLRVLRKARDWTVFELSRQSRVNPSDVSQIELGRKVPPAGSVTLGRLALAIGWTGDPSALLDEVDG